MESLGPIDDMVKWAWLQAGFLGLFCILVALIIFAAWKIISVLWKDNMSLRDQLIKADQRNAVIAETSKAAIDRIIVSTAENNNLIRTFIAKTLG